MTGDHPAVASLARLPIPDLDPKEIRTKARAIGRELLARSPYVNAPDFSAIHPDDLAFLLDAYDERFLSGLIRRRLADDRLSFRLSSRMTRAGGQTTRRTRPGGGSDYEIAVSTFILFDGFGDDDPEVSVAGLPCANRLEALQRIMEHEIVHLAEFLCTGRSSCAENPFQDAARRLFGHRTNTHALITRRRRAAQDGILVGSFVTFSWHGRELTGRVNRITKRATVLVEDPRGSPYSDGRRYAKYYVPLSWLRPAESPGC